MSSDFESQTMFKKRKLKLLSQQGKKRSTLGTRASQKAMNDIGSDVRSFERTPTDHSGAGGALVSLSNGNEAQSRFKMNLDVGKSPKVSGRNHVQFVSP